MEANKRAQRIVSQFLGQKSQQLTASPTAASDSLSITDNRTGKNYEIPIHHNVVDSSALFKITPDKGPGLRTYDPGYMNTSSAKSEICFIDGPKGVLTYRGYTIEDLAQKSSFTEVAFLILFGDLPTAGELTEFNGKVMKHTFIHEDLKKMMSGFRYDAHPMGMLVSTLAAMSTLHPEANPALAGTTVYDDPKMVNKQIFRLIGTIGTIAANCYRHRIGRPFVDPPDASENMSYTESFMYMLDKLSHKEYKPHPKLAEALNVLFILHADHELNCSTAAMRHLASSGVDVYSATSGACAALYGPSHGGANEAVLRMLESIGDVSNIPQFLQDVKDRKVKLMGFGHRVYKNYDPRARLIRGIASEVFEIVGKEPLIEVAVALEAAALADAYFVDRKLYPNVDFYSGLIYKAMGFPTDFFPVLFAIPRTVGWLAHWKEHIADKEQKIVRPRQVYLGSAPRPYVEVDQRKSCEPNMDIPSSTTSRRREI
jgi:citrate synthase